MNKTYSSTMFTAFLFFIFRFRLIHHSLNLFLILLNDIFDTRLQIIPAAFAFFDPIAIR